jgi:hypothetical protein
MMGVPKFPKFRPNSAKMMGVPKFPQIPFAS